MEPTFEHDYIPETEQPAVTDHFFVDGRHFANGRSAELAIPAGNSSTISIPLIEGRDITLTTQNIDQSMLPANTYFAINQEEGLYITTFPITNAPFHYNHPGLGEPNNSIHCVTEEQTSSANLGSYEENRMRPRESESLSLDFQDKFDIDMILAAEGLVVPSKNVSKKPVKELLDDVFTYVDEHSSGSREDVEESNDMKLGYLLEELIKHKEFPGTCKSVATLTTGICRALGIPARVVSGEIFADGTTGGHNWCEVFLKKISSWAPLDPAMGTFLVYPSSDVIYSIEGAVQNTRDSFDENKPTLTVLWNDNTGNA